MNCYGIMFSCYWLFLVSSISYAQGLLSNQTTRVSNHVVKQIKPRHCSLQAALLIQDLQAGSTISNLKAKYTVYENDQGSYIPSLLTVSDDFDRRKFKEYQVHVNTDLGNIFSLQIPIDQYEAFVGTPGIKYIELAKKVYPKLDKALINSRVDAVHNGQNLSQSYNGKGVVVGIIDFGFDYTHPTFSDPETGTLRIKQVWEQNNLSGNPPPGYTYGHELAQEQAIINAGTDISLSGHGTHVASIAAGSGGVLEATYRGVAYQSDIVLVSLNARDGTSGNNTGVIDGINYIFQYAESVGKPAVINISQGHHTGPHDGTSLADQAIDAMSGPGKIIVGAVGNEGDTDGFYLHFDHTFDQENSILSYLVWPDELSAGIALVDIWGEAGTDFEVSIEIFNPQTRMLEVSGEVLRSDDPVSFMSGKLVDLEGDTLYYEGGIEVNPLNNRPHAQFYIDNTAQSTGNDVHFEDLLDNDFVQLRFKSDRGTIHAYAANNSGAAFFTDLSGIGADEFTMGTRVLGGNPRSTMGELGGTAHSIISVGGYTTKNSFVNNLGESYSIEDVIGAKYFKSSQGPTHDGRIKPDISAPANLIAAAENSFFADFDEVLGVGKISNPGGNDWKFSIRRGTSAAAPLVAGIVALMLEADPNLTPEKAKDLLADHARKDNFTGSVPNHVWGYGKVDAAGVMTSLDQPTATHAHFVDEQTKIFPNPSKGTFSLQSEAVGPIEIKIIDSSGRLLYERNLSLTTEQLTIALPNPAPGIYFLHLKQKDRTTQKKLIVLE
ncbi:MAG: S8 family peptidase [Saprospiraceae bacterium]|nr:S8 family peptidase [Saprospiraceae bacterium]